MKLKIAQVIGLNTDQKAAQTISSTRDSGDTFLAVLELASDDAFTKGRQALSELEDFYFEFEGSAAEKLTAAFSEAEKKFRESDFDLCLAAISGKVLYLIAKGQVEVYLKRADKISSLLSAGASAQLISGFIAAADRLLLSTGNLITFLGQELEKSLNLPIEMFEEEVGSKIRHAEPESAGESSSVSDLENEGLAALAIEVMEQDLEIAPLQHQDTDQVLSQDYPGKRLAFQAFLTKAVVLIDTIRTNFPKSNRGRLILAVVLIVTIAFGAGYKYKLSRDQKIQLLFDQKLQEAKDDFNAAKELASLNPAEAKNKLELAKDKVNQALKLKSHQEAQNLKNTIEQESSAILQQSSVSDFPVFLDMDLVKKNFRASQLSLSAGKLLILDPGVKTLVVVDLTKKSNQILAGTQALGDATFASLNGGFAFVFSKDKGILRIDIANSKLTVVSKIDADLGKIADIYGFGGNVYILDTLNQIWKYLPTNEGYSDKREYLSKNTKVEFANALRMQIESSVYILKSGGEILRFTRGGKDNFSYTLLPSGVKDPKSFFVSSDTDNLYLLDSGNSRLLILTKTGEFKGQISGDKFGTATDLVVDEVGKKVYLLDGGKIYSLDLK